MSYDLSRCRAQSRPHTDLASPCSGARSGTTSRTTFLGPAPPHTPSTSDAPTVHGSSSAITPDETPNTCSQQIGFSRWPNQPERRDPDRACAQPSRRRDTGGVMTPILKYPRTPHLAGSRVQAGDEELPVIAPGALRGVTLVVEEKLDGVLPQAEREILFAAALLHDVAKPACTREEAGRITSRGHSLRGAIDSRGILWELDGPFQAREMVCGLVRYHQVPFHLIGRSDAQRMAYRISQSAAATCWRFSPKPTPPDVDL
jgi:hypothetical protein